MLASKIFTHFLLIIFTVPSALPGGAPVLPERLVEEPSTSWVQQKDAQTLQVVTVANVAPLDRDSYSATTVEEVAAIVANREAEKKAAEEQARKAQEEAERRQQLATSKASDNSYYSQVNPQCASQYCWPVTDFTFNPSINGFRTAERPDHKGFDMLAPALTPIYAVTEGTVTVSSDNHYDFGAAVVVVSNVDGALVQMTYAHMTYGTQRVSVGDVVKPGQMLGQVGMTGAATANHLHLEIRVNGTPVDPQAWLVAHAG